MVDSSHANLANDRFSVIIWWQYSVLAVSKPFILSSCLRDSHWPHVIMKRPQCSHQTWSLRSHLLALVCSHCIGMAATAQIWIGIEGPHTMKGGLNLGFCVLFTWTQGNEDPVSLWFFQRERDHACREDLRWFSFPTSIKANLSTSEPVSLLPTHLLWNSKTMVFLCLIQRDRRERPVQYSVVQNKLF